MQGRTDRSSAPRTPPSNSRSVAFGPPISMFQIGSRNIEKESVIMSWKTAALVGTFTIALAGAPLAVESIPRPVVPTNIEVPADTNYFWLATLSARRTTSAHRPRPLRRTTGCSSARRQRCSMPTGGRSSLITRARTLTGATRFTPPGSTPAIRAPYGPRSSPARPTPTTSPRMRLSGYCWKSPETEVETDRRHEGVR